MWLYNICTRILHLTARIYMAFDVIYPAHFAAVTPFSASVGSSSALVRSNSAIISLVSQPTSARREGSGELSIRLLSRRNVISYAMFGLRLCDHGIISRCSAAPRQSGHANRNVDHFLKATRSFTIAASSDTTRTMPSRSRLTDWNIPGCIAKAFVVAYPVSRATETPFLHRSTVAVDIVIDFALSS